MPIPAEEILRTARIMDEIFSQLQAAEAACDVAHRGQVSAATPV